MCLKVDLAFLGSGSDLSWTASRSELGFMQGRAGENSSSSDEDERASRSSKSTAIVFGSSGAVVQKSDQNATATREVDTELEKDQRLVSSLIRFRLPVRLLPFYCKFTIFTIQVL